MLQPKKAILTHGPDFYKLDMLIIVDEFRGKKTKPCHWILMKFNNFHLELKESTRNLKQLEQGIIFINIKFILEGEGARCNM